MRYDHIVELGNLLPQRGKWHSPQIGRIYSIYGCSPCINTMGGGNRQPKVLVEHEI